MSPRQARASGLTLRNLGDAEGRALEALADILLPGAGEAGVVHYVDDQLARGNPSFILKYLDYPGPCSELYRQGLAALERVSLARYGRQFEQSTPDRKVGLVRELANGGSAEWSGPPAGLFYFVVRNDALDVLYGTPEGFEKLQVPYMPHIAPPQPCGYSENNNPRFTGQLPPTGYVYSTILFNI